MYSFGCLLYEAYSRKEPFVDEEDVVKVLTLVAMKNKRPGIPKTCPPQIKSLMVECYAAKPEHRPFFEEVDQRLKRVEISEASTKLDDEALNSSDAGMTVELSTGDGSATSTSKGAVSASYDL